MTNQIIQKLCACGCGQPGDGTWRRGHNRERKVRPDRPFCACGCGAQTNWNKNAKQYGQWCVGHSARKRPRVTPTCACGCGRHVRVWNERDGWAKYALGHNLKFVPRKPCKGERYDRNGYVMLYGKPYAAYPNGQVKRSRYVMEQHLGRRLSRDEQVHHINRIKDDDRIDNLQVVTIAEHNAIHADERRAGLKARNYMLTGRAKRNRAR